MYSEMSLLVPQMSGNNTSNCQSVKGQPKTDL